VLPLGVAIDLVDAWSSHQRRDKGEKGVPIPEELAARMTATELRMAVSQGRHEFTNPSIAGVLSQLLAIPGPAFRSGEEPVDYDRFLRERLRKSSPPESDGGPEFRL
jgi:hypothetical protein